MQEAARKGATRPVTVEDWKNIEQELIRLYNRVVLICDGYDLTLVLERHGQFRNVIAIYVNGVVEGRWIMEDCEERRRFFCPKTKRVYSEKKLAGIKKLSRKLYKELAAARYTCYEPYWSSFRAMKSHLIKNNKNIEMMVGD